MPKWRKVLFEAQPFPDNYVDSSFLQALRTNENFTEYAFDTTVAESAAVVQQISLVATFGVLFNYALEETLSAEVLIGLNLVLAAAGYGARVAMDPTLESVAALVDNVKIFVLFFGTLLALSPVLRTLTIPFADDTIWALTISCLSVHVFFTDYTYVNGWSDQFRGHIALNAAVFASVLMGSRLKSDGLVFGFVSFAMQVFALLPIVRRSLRLYSDHLHQRITTGLVGATLVLLLTISRLVACLYLAAVVFIAFICPMWLVRIQKYKSAIHGPWDEAVPVQR